MKNRKVPKKPQAAPQSTPARKEPEAAPAVPPCDNCKPLRQLKAEAKELKIRYFSRLKRQELEEAVQCAREKGIEDLARLKELEQIGKQRSDALWAAWRQKNQRA